MSYDLAVWGRPRSELTPPGTVYARLIEDDAHLLLADQRVLTYRERALFAYPVLRDVVAPDEVSADTDKYFSVTIPFGYLGAVSIDRLAEWAEALDLVFYDPQLDSDPTDDDESEHDQGEQSRATIEVGEWFLETLSRHGRRVPPPPPP